MTNAKRLAPYVAGALFVLVLGVFVWRATEKETAPKPIASEFADARADRTPRPVRRTLPPEPREEPAPAESVAEAERPSPQLAADGDDRFANRSVVALMARLSSDDQHLVLDSADGLRARKAVEAIPKLATLNVADNPDSARGVIKALGELAGVADPEDRELATDRLITLLAQEKARNAPDAPGNVLQIYEALGHTGDPRAAAALEPELSDDSVPLAALTVVAQALGSLHQPSSVTALSQARARVAALSFDDAFMTEVQKDVLAAIDQALTSLDAR